MKAIVVNMIFVVPDDDLQYERENVRSALNSSLEWDEWPSNCYQYNVYHRDATSREVDFANESDN